MLGLGERRRSWHESEHSLDRVTEYLPRSRSYEHIDESMSGDGAEPHTVDDPEDPRLSSDSANQKPSQKSRKTRKKASSNTSKLAKNSEVEIRDGESRLEESRLLDIRNHHVPKKLSSLSEGAPHATSSTSASTSSSSAIRKGSMANIFKGISIPGRDRKGRNSRAEKSSPRHKSSSNMPIIHSDTDTDNDQRRMRSSDRTVRRNESNSSASISRNNSLKGEGTKGSQHESGSDFEDSDFEEDPELNAADIPDTWYAFTDQKNNPNVKEKSGRFSN